MNEDIQKVVDPLWPSLAKDTDIWSELEDTYVSKAYSNFYEALYLSIKLI